MPWSSQAVIAETVIVEGPSGGTFSYDASGNLRTANVGQTTTDPQQGITCYAGFSSFNGHGAVISLFSSTLDAQFWYSDTGSSTQGSLIASIASQGGTDPFGTTFFEGFVVYNGPPGMFVEMSGNEFSFGSNAAATRVTEDGALSMTDALTNAAQPILLMSAPGTTTGPRAAIALFGESEDATAPSQMLVGSSPAAVSLPVTTALLEVEGIATPSDPAIQVIANAAADNSFGIRVTGDTFNRLRVDSNGQMRWGSGTAGQDVTLARQAAHLLALTVADLDVATAGRGLRVAEGSNAKQGTATLSAGTIVVANTSVTATSRIMLTAQDNSSTGALRVSARTAGTSFTITSSNAADSGVVAFQIFEPG